MKYSLMNLESGTFIVDSGELIAAQMFSQGVWENQIFEISKFLLNDCEAPTILDIGANFGAYTIPMALNVMANNGIIYAFEPQRRIYNQLCGNIFVNNLDNVYAFNYALGKEESILNIKVPNYTKFKNPGAFSLDIKTMVSRNLENYLSEKVESILVKPLNTVNTKSLISLIKIDVEGMELDVILGGEQLLKQNCFPPIIFESWNDDKFRDKKQLLFAKLESIGYELLPITNSDFIAQHKNSQIKRKIIKNSNSRLTGCILS